MVPVVDLEGGGWEWELVRACEGVGFVALSGHGIDPALIERMRRLTTEVFALDERTKAEFRISPSDYRGFIPLGFFTPNRSEVNGRDADRYEGFKLHWECPPGHPAASACALYGPNRWLPALPHMRDTVLAYWSSCDDVAWRLLGAMADRLRVDVSTLRRLHAAPLTNMTLLRYPAWSAPDPPPGIHPHKDTNVLTILVPDVAGGLELRDRGGRWMPVDVPDGALVVNIGEMLELWSGGRFRATPHRVVHRSTSDRYAFPWFLVPSHDVVVEPLVEPIDGFAGRPMPVGELSAEVWRTNWRDVDPLTDRFDLGALDRPSG